MARNGRRWPPGMSQTALAAVVALTCLTVIGLLMRPSPARPLRPILITTSNWFPFTAEESDGGGPASRMVSDIFRSAGYSPTIDFTSWDSSLARVQSGEAVGAFPFTSASADRRAYLSSEPLLEFDYVLFHRAQDPISEATLPNLRVAKIDGYEYWPELDQRVKNYIPMPTINEAFEALATGTVDVVPEAETVGIHHIHGPSFLHDSASITRTTTKQPWARNTRTLHLLMRKSPEADRVMAAFNISLRAYKTSPAMETIQSELSMEFARDKFTTAAPTGDSWLLTSNGEPIERLPNGSEGVVLDWPQSLSTTTASDLAHVKITSGPLRGREGWLNIENICLSP